MNNFSLDQLERIREILGKTTVQCRKGEAIERTEVGEVSPGRPAMVIQEVFDMPTEGQMTAENIEFIDVHFMTVAVQKDAVEPYREEVKRLLLEWPQPDRLASGPGYMELGGLLGDQGIALQLMALGKVMGYWDVITPEVMGFEGEIAKTMAGQGMVYITGWRPE